MEYRRDAIFVEMGQSIQDMSGVQMLLPFFQCFLYGTCVVILDLHVPKSPFQCTFDSTYGLCHKLYYTDSRFQIDSLLPRPLFFVQRSASHHCLLLMYLQSTIIRVYKNK